MIPNDCVCAWTKTIDSWTFVWKLWINSLVILSLLGWTDGRTDGTWLINQTSCRNPCFAIYYPPLTWRRNLPCQSWDISNHPCPEFWIFAARLLNHENVVILMFGGRRKLMKQFFISWNLKLAPLKHSETGCWTVWIILLCFS